MFRNKFIHIIVFLIGFSAFSQVNFTTKLSKNQLGLNERVKVEFSVDKDGDNFIPPTFENFRIVGFSKDPDNDERGSANVNVIVKINEHFYSTTTGV